MAITQPGGLGWVQGITSGILNRFVTPSAASGTTTASNGRRGGSGTFSAPVAPVTSGAGVGRFLQNGNPQSLNQQYMGIAGQIYGTTPQQVAYQANPMLDQGYASYQESLRQREAQTRAQYDQQEQQLRGMYNWTEPDPYQKSLYQDAAASLVNQLHSGIASNNQQYAGSQDAALALGKQLAAYGNTQGDMQNDLYQNAAAGITADNASSDDALAAEFAGLGVGGTNFGDSSDAATMLGSVGGAEDGLQQALGQLGYTQQVGLATSLGEEQRANNAQLARDAAVMGQDLTNTYGQREAARAQSEHDQFREAAMALVNSTNAQGASYEDQIAQSALDLANAHAQQYQSTNDTNQSLALQQDSDVRGLAGELALGQYQKTISANAATSPATPKFTAAASVGGSVSIPTKSEVVDGKTIVTAATPVNVSQAAYLLQAGLDGAWQESGGNPTLFKTKAAQVFTGLDPTFQAAIPMIKGLPTNPDQALSFYTTG